MNLKASAEWVGNGGNAPPRRREALADTNVLPTQGE